MRKTKKSNNIENFPANDMPKQENQNNQPQNEETNMAQKIDCLNIGLATEVKEQLEPSFQQVNSAVLNAVQGIKSELQSLKDKADKNNIESLVSKKQFEKFVEDLNNQLFSIKEEIKFVKVNIDKIDQSKFATKSQMDSLLSQLTGLIQSTSQVIKNELNYLQHDVEKIEMRMVIKLGAMITTVAGIAATIFKLL
jgi:hypothetical protein